MKKFCVLVPLLYAFALVGCLDRETRMRTYLEELSTCQARIRSLSQEFQLGLGQVSQKSAPAPIETARWEKDWDHLEERLKAERFCLEALVVPEAATELHQATLEQCQILIETVEVTRPLLEVSGDLARANRRVEDDPRASKKMIEEIERGEARRESLASKLEELNARSQDCEDQISHQYRRLEKEFDIPLQVEDGP